MSQSGPILEMHPGETALQIIDHNIARFDRLAVEHARAVCITAAHDHVAWDQIAEFNRCDFYRSLLMELGEHLRRQESVR